MAEPTDIRTKMGTAEKMVTDGTLAFRQYMDIPYIPEEEEFLFKEFGGKPGQGRVKTPKKLTVKQAFALLDYSGFPLADENAKFSIASSIKLSAPELFDDSSFKAYEKKFGKTMEMQEKGASASKNITTAKTPKAANQPVADLDPKTATLREVAEAYAEKSKRGKAFVTSSLQFFKDIADEPGSALRLFEKDSEGVTLLSKTFKGTEDTSTVKTAMQNLRQVGLTLKESIGPDTPEYKLLPDKAPNTDLNNRIFGRSEPAKAVSEVAINPDKAKMSQLFAGVAKYLDNPNTKAIAQAIIFNLNTGLRPNAAAGLQLNAYKPDSGAIYIEAETKGAKGRAVNIPLNPIADSILQENLAAGNKENFFIKPNGKVVTSADMTDLLKDVKVKDIAFDAATGRYFDTLAPAKFSGKKGSALLRNIHATVGQSIGVDQDRLAYLQGRSLKSAGKSSTGELTTYQQAFPGAVGEVDRQNANMFAEFWGTAAKDAGFDIQTKIPMPETRITTQTAGYEGYFDLPVREEVSVAKQPVTPASVDDVDPAPNPEARDSLLKRGFDPKGMANALVDFMNKSGKAVVGAAAFETIRQFAEAPLETGAAIAKEIGLEAAARAAGLGLGPAAAVPMILEPSELASGDLRPEDQPQDPAGPYAGQDFIPAPEVEQGTPRTDMARIAREDAGFIPEPSRVPEAAPARNEGFLSR
jgi:integrase